MKNYININNPELSIFDKILILSYPKNINEDNRYYTGKSPVSVDKSAGYSASYLADNPMLFANNNFARALESDLTSLGRGYSAEITDFGKWVTAKITYSNYITGKTASKTYLIVFESPNSGNGMVVNTSNRFRTVSGVSQAGSYIRSSASALRSETERKI